MDNQCIKLVQVTKYRWNLVSPKGHIMVDGFLATSPYAASEWCRKYISSFPTWTYEVILKEAV